MREDLEDLEVSFWLQGVSYLIKVLSSFSLQRPWGDVRPESPPLAIPLTPALPRAPEAAAPAHAMGRLLCALGPLRPHPGLRSPSVAWS